MGTKSWIGLSSNLAPARRIMQLQNMSTNGFVMRERIPSMHSLQRPSFPDKPRHQRTREEPATRKCVTRVEQKLPAVTVACSTTQPLHHDKLAPIHAPWLTLCRLSQPADQKKQLDIAGHHNVFAKRLLWCLRSLKLRLDANGNVPS